MLFYTIFSILGVFDSLIRFLILKSRIESSQIDSILK